MMRLAPNANGQKFDIFSCEFVISNVYFLQKIRGIKYKGRLFSNSESMVSVYSAVHKATGLTAPGRSMV